MIDKEHDHSGLVSALGFAQALVTSLKKEVSALKVEIGKRASEIEELKNENTTGKVRGELHNALQTIEKLKRKIRQQGVHMENMQRAIHLRNVEIERLQSHATPIE